MKEKPTSIVVVRSVKPDAVLGEIVGRKPVPRIEITRRLWSYIKTNNLQDPKKPKIIRADRRLKALFDGRVRVDQFTMEKFASNHLT